MIYLKTDFSDLLILMLVLLANRMSNCYFINHFWWKLSVFTFVHLFGPQTGRKACPTVCWEAYLHASQHAFLPVQLLDSLLLGSMSSIVCFVHLIYLKGIPKYFESV